MKKKLFLVLAVLTLSLAGCGSSGTDSSENAGGSSTEPIVLKAAHTNSESSNIHQATVRFNELLEEKSEGRLSLDIYPNSTYGSANDIDEGLFDGSLDILCGPVSNSHSPLLSLLNAPSVFSDYDKTLEAVTDSPFRDWYIETAESIGLKPLAWTAGAYREVSSNKEILSADDLQGLAIRVPENAVQTVFWEGLGATPTVVSFSDLYISLQNGLIDAQENPLDLIISQKLYEQQEYIVMTNHMMQWYGFTMNKDNFDALPEDLQQILIDCAGEAAEYARTLALENEASQMEFLEGEGLTIIEFTEEDYQKMYDRSEAAFELLREECGEEAFNTMLSSLGLN